MKLLFIDTETGGVIPEKHSLLSVGLAVWEDGEVIYSKEMYVKNEVYHVTASALKINRINLIDADEGAYNKSDVIAKLKMIKSVYFNNERMTVAGHNVAFDVGFIKKMYTDCGREYLDDFAYRTVDTSAILKYLYLGGHFKEDLSASDKAFGYYGLIKPDDVRRHTALGDCSATVKLFNCLLKECHKENIQ